MKYIFLLIVVAHLYYTHQKGSTPNRKTLFSEMDSIYQFLSGVVVILCVLFPSLATRMPDMEIFTMMAGIQMAWEALKKMSKRRRGGKKS